MEENEEDIIWGDEEIEGEGDSGTTFYGENPIEEIWEDAEGGYHELMHGLPELDDAEIRVSFQTFDEARDYINEILTGADQYFDIYYIEGEDPYAVYYMGGSE